VKGLADVQLEHGYTRIANDILENLATIKLSPTQYRILFLVWRYTYGFKRKEHDLSLTFLSNATGCDKRQIQRELKTLEEKKIIFQDIKTGSYRKISFNKNHEEWVGKTAIGEITIGEIDNGGIVNTAIGETVNTTIGEIDNQERKYLKKNIKKDTTTTVVENPVNYFEQVLCRLSEIQMNKLYAWQDDFGGQAEIVNEAIRLADDKNKRYFGFVEFLLKEWHNNKLSSVERIRVYEQEKFNKQKTPRKGSFNKPTRTELVPGWYNKPDSEPQQEQLTPEAQAKQKALEEKLKKFKKEPTQ
jgi:phage replication O-like protein O